MIRRANRDEIVHFNLYHEDNQGTEFIVVERENNIVGFAQFDEGYTDATIHFIEAESSGKGVQYEIISWFQENFTELTTTNTNPHCQKFLINRGFEVVSKDFYKNAQMKWFAE